jgi:hypothetical protein
MSQFELDERTRAVLDRVRHSTATLSVDVMRSDLAEAAVWEIGKIVLSGRFSPSLILVSPLAAGRGDPARSISGEPRGYLPAGTISGRAVKMRKVETFLPVYRREQAAS